MSKLHELLAVQDSLRKQAEATRSDLKNTFEKKRHHFTAVTTTFKSNKEGVADKEEKRLGLQSTIAKELEWIGEKLAKAIDAGHQIDLANCAAKADVTLDSGSILLKDVPATSLLQLEKRIQEIMDLVQAIPTLDPAKGFEPDPSQPAGVYKARDVEKPRTEKAYEVLELARATDKHPAQVEKLTVDRVIGTIFEQEWSSLITIKDKGDMLDRVESLLRAVRKARSRANDEDVDQRQNKIGSAIVNYVFTGAS